MDSSGVKMEMQEHYLYFGPVIALLLFKIYLKVTCGYCKSDAQLQNKLAIITGANSGIGYETARELARRGAKVILACRNSVKGHMAAKKIIMDTNNSNVTVKYLDLNSFASIRKFAKDILETEGDIHILINNAGTGKLDNTLTLDNLPIEMQGNYFGPFLLTNLLLPQMISAAPARIINVSSIMHIFGKIDLERITKPANNFLQHARVYSNSKLANILFTRQLKRHLVGTRVTANSLHPGAVNTDIFRNQFRVIRFIQGFFFKSPYEGAQTSIYCAVAPELQEVSGKYFSDCKEAWCSKAARDDEMARKLWELSEEVTQFKSWWAAK